MDTTIGGGTMGRCQVLSGVGGVGKTQLAAHYARSAWQAGEVDLLVWVTASSRESVIAAYAQAVEETLSGPLSDPERAASAFLAWLHPRPPSDGSNACRWLVVLDDVADPGHLRGLWPPSSPSGRTLLTTRRRDAALTGPERNLMEVGLFTPAEAAAYLGDALAVHGRHEAPEQLAALALDLGYLPLALSQAAAYLIDADLDCATYRTRLADRNTSLTTLLPDSSGLPDDQAVTVTAAWSLSLEQANQTRPRNLARPMLQLAAMLNANSIPDRVLTSPPALAYLADQRAATPQCDHPREPLRTTTAEEATSTLRTLHRLNLIDHTPKSPHRAVRIHQLIQRAVRDNVPAGQIESCARAAADALMTVWPDVERDTALAQVLRANAETLRGLAEDALWRPGAHPLLLRAGQSLGETGQVTAARDYIHHLVVTSRTRLGPDHPHTLDARRHLACWQGEAGDPTGAVVTLTSLLPHQQQLLGPDHPNTLRTRSDLGHWQRYAGDTAGAVTTFTLLLTDQQRLLGPDHPDTLITRHDLAHCQARNGDFAAGANALAELLPHLQERLGADHPTTLLTRHDLAFWQSKASGDPARAVGALAQLLPDMERVLGPGHHHAQITRSNLANFRGEAGDAAGAAATLTTLLADRKRILGADHPKTLLTCSDLIRWQAHTEDPATVTEAFTDLLEKMEQVLGPDHPTTLKTRSYLARFWDESGNTADAVSELTGLLADQERILGPHHPDTVTTRDELFQRGR
ncbi:tetratricopeptide repeat protein [Streptomyces decoyicus]|uniref:Tetratricopeptide repeat protein n=1 Tax=Streptomyces decoyicus TaxID=249567 RepID=A0ABZ1FU97_9ACTN|nr:tetratricopeptide repeat protein [Streptomyces decoyicus]WSB73465.1 tetratricopeptide repeat protein [Streptomyces decoyicus]